MTSGGLLAESRQPRELIGSTRHLDPKNTGASAAPGEGGWLPELQLEDGHALQTRRQVLAKRLRGGRPGLAKEAERQMEVLGLAPADARSRRAERWQRVTVAGPQGLDELDAEECAHVQRARKDR